MLRRSFFPKWLYSGGTWANRLQYVLAIPVGLTFGWLFGVAYLAVVALVVKIMMSLFSTSRLGTSMAASLMQAHIERRVQTREFRWDAGTSEEGERLFEELFRSALDLLRRLPQRT
ncbi:MAG: hypothetical protein AB7M05_21010 [Alphaproteobacteria bacterium]